MAPKGLLARAPAATTAASKAHLSVAPVLGSRVAAPAVRSMVLRAAPALRFSTSAEEEDVDIDGVAYGFMASQALFTALEIGVYDEIAISPGGSLSFEALKSACGVDAWRLETLLTSLVAFKSLKLDRPGGVYSLSPNTARFLVQSSRNYYGDYLKYQIGRQFYGRMESLPKIMATGEAPSYADWFSNPEEADTYTKAQHNGSTATAKVLVRKKLSLAGVGEMLDVGGGSGAFSYVFAAASPELKSTVLELPGVCASAAKIKSEQPQDIQDRVSYVELDATSPSWPVPETHFDLVLMSYISGSVPEFLIEKLYANAHKALKPGGRLVVHDFMVDDSLDGPALAAYWALQHVTVNSAGLGLCPAKISERMGRAGFDLATLKVDEMIHGLTKVMSVTKK
eukprot:CAMPEP_0172645718 /NCGR_PEP_ID=MMETSP1068-20121228/239875_1 /TAXON_ID=35684 /ORGANISM="Pseudopedinella elastica, Strain CCMP716" /LENGTH=396 /DNA_ID=CAMNT_0013459965 /DNA_START=61 /DNA_END=1251 /DNA_ORIENTATION=-